MVQSFWRGYKLRKTLSTFKYLPTEIWSHILHFIILQDKKHNHTCKVYANIYIQQYNKYWHI